MKTMKELREEFAKIRAEADKIINDAIAANKELTKEEQEANDARFSRLEQITKIMNEQSRFAKMVMENAAAETASGIVGTQDPAGKSEIEKSLAANAAFAVSGKIDRAEFSKACAKWCNTGDMDKKFATITTATQSGIFLPVEVVQPLVPTVPNTFRQAFAIWGIPTLSTPMTSKMNVPVLTATAGGVVSETANTETENEPGTSGSIVSAPATYHSGTSWFSNLELAANDFDLVSAYTPAWMMNKELGFEAAIAAAIQADAGITQVVTTSAPTTFTVADLANLDQALPKRYQQFKVILLSATAYGYACGLTFASGGFVLTTDNNGVRRYNGTPVLRCDNFAALGATNKIGCILSLPGFHIRDAGQVQIIRYVQVPARPAQSGFDLVAFHAYGYDPSAMAMFTAHA